MFLRMLLTAAPALALIPAPSAPVPSGSPVCRDVRGTIEASVDRIRPAMTGLRFEGAGMSRGDLEGAVAVRALKRPAAKSLVLHLVITTSSGLVEVSGKATADASETEPHLRAIRGTWAVMGQTGAARGDAGTVSAAGTADTRARSAAIAYAGRICAEKPEVDANPRVVRREVGKRLVPDA